MEDSAEAAATGPGHAEVGPEQAAIACHGEGTGLEAINVEGRSEAMKVEGEANAAAAAWTGMQGDVTAEPPAEEGDGASAAVPVVPQFSYAALEGATWACPHCQERHRRVLEG